MKVYPLRMDDAMMDRLKAIGLKEKKSLRDIILGALEEKIQKREEAKLKAKQENERKLLLQQQESAKALDVILEKALCDMNLPTSIVTTSTHSHSDRGAGDSSHSSLHQLQSQQHSSATLSASSPKSSVVSSASFSVSSSATSSLSQQQQQPAIQQQPPRSPAASPVASAAASHAASAAPPLHSNSDPHPPANYDALL
jgi:hypothetical protein